MWAYIPPLRDMRFVIAELLAVQDDWAEMPPFAALDADATAQILEEAGKFAADVVAPLNGAGDLQGCRYEEGRVAAPDGFAAAYRRFCDAGWPALACDRADGGQGLPQIINAALYEMLFATNHAWSMYPGLAHGAYECLRAHAPEHLKSSYLPHIVSGEWLATMCLTEPQAGSDVGLLRTRAEPRLDGSYTVTGSKIFISGGEHDLTDNIVHLVLARLPDAPVGTKGISLFLVPKRLPGENRDNLVRCDGIERKMGIKASATCVMSFNGAQGWMIGEPHRGLAALFVMMNSARLYVGLQGLGHAEMASQNARRYAAERRQMRAATRPPEAHFVASDQAADPILYQPAVRRTLLTSRALVEGERALGYWCAHLLDISAHHPDANRRSRAHDQASVLTPIIKSLFTENGFTLSSAALQIWGGYGYIHEFGIEQTVRDCRIAMIYEGTNEIQAIDLVVRKVIGDGGVRFRTLMDSVVHEVSLCSSVPSCIAFGDALKLAHGELMKAVGDILAESLKSKEYSCTIATDFLYACGLLLIGSFWARASRLSARRADEPFFRVKLATAQFYFDYLLPQTHIRLEAIAGAKRPLPWLECE